MDNDGLITTVPGADWLTVGATASRLGITPGRVRQLIAARRLLAAKAGDEWRIDPQSVAGRIAPAGNTVAALAAELSITPGAVYQRLTRLGLETQGGQLSGADAVAVRSLYRDGQYEARPHTLSSVAREAGYVLQTVSRVRGRLNLGQWFESGRHGGEWRLTNYEAGLLKTSLPKQRPQK